MKPNKTTKVKIFNSYEDNIEDIPETPDDFLSFWKQKFDLIPREYMESAKIEYAAEQCYDVPYLEVEVSYERPENEYEAAQRINREDEQRAEVKRHDLKQLAELKEKYGEV